MTDDAQRDILKMLAENVINVEEAERLLKAVNEGKQRRDDRHSRRRRPSHGPATGGGSMFDSIGEALSGIGPMVKNTVEDVMTGIFGDDTAGLDDEDLVDVEPPEEEHDIGPGTRMVIVNDSKWGPKAGDLRIRGAQGSLCRIENVGGQHLRVRRSPTHFVIQCAGGPIQVDVPETAGELLVRSKGKGGDIHIAGVHSDMSVRTIAGDLALEDILKDFKARTMGGDVELKLHPEWRGSGSVRAMGGDIVLTAPEGVGFHADAFTMGGTISAAEGMEKVESEPGFPGKKRAKIHAGPPDSASTISIKTMGGDITLRKDARDADGEQE